MKKRSAQMAAFTIVEALIVTLIIVLLSLIIIPTRPHQHHFETNGCINNLRQIGQAFQVFALEHSERFPWQCPATNSGTLELIGSESPAPHFQIVSNSVRSYDVLACPADGARQAVTN